MADKDPPPPPASAPPALQVTETDTGELNFSVTAKEAEERSVRNQVQFRLHDGQEFFICNWTGRLIPRAVVEPLRSNSKRGARNAFLDIGCLVAFCKHRAQVKGHGSSYAELLGRIARFYGIGKDEMPLPMAPDPKLLDNMTIAEYQKLYMPESLLEQSRVQQMTLSPDEFREKHGNKRANRKRSASASAAEGSSAAEPPLKKQDVPLPLHLYRQMPGQATPLELTPARGGTVKDLERSLAEELPGAFEFACRRVITGGIMFWQAVPSPKAGKNVRAERMLYRNRETAHRPVVGPAIWLVGERLPSDAAQGDGEVSGKAADDQQS